VKRMDTNPRFDHQDHAQELASSMVDGE